MSIPQDLHEMTHFKLLANHLEIGATSLTIVCCVEGASNKSDLPAGKGSIMCLSHEGTIDEELEIITVGNNKESILFAWRCNNKTARIFNEVGITGSRAGIVPA